MWHIFGAVFCHRMGEPQLELFRNAPIRITPDRHMLVVGTPLDQTFENASSKPLVDRGVWPP
jgi:hypothetical protein